MAVNKDLQAVFLEGLAQHGFEGPTSVYKGVQLHDTGNTIDMCTYVLPQPDWCPYTEVNEMLDYMNFVMLKGANDFAAWAAHNRSTYSMILKPRFVYDKNIAIVLFYRISVTGGPTLLCHCSDSECVPRCSVLMSITHTSRRS